MLLNYSVTNFHSIVDKVAVSFQLNKRDVVSGWDRVSPSGLRTSTAMAVIGPNGAGKTSLIKVPAFIAWFIQSSFNARVDDPMPFQSHATKQEELTTFEFEADGEHGWRWKYELSAYPSHVVREALYRKNVEPGDRYSYVFIRDWTGDGYAVKQQGFGVAEAEAVKVRKNVSFISWGKQYGAELATLVSSFLVITNITQLGRMTSGAEVLLLAADYFAKPGVLRDQMTDLLRNWDLGLNGMDFRQVDIASADGSTPQKRWYPIGLHSSGDTAFELPFAFESGGTQTAFVMLSRVLPVLAEGGVAVIDELEADLHPHMIEAVLRLFHDAETNPHGAQILFTCHSPEVLRFLGKAQVMFVEKTDCMTTAYRGDQIEGLTNAHNLYAKYMSGALGAVPQI